MMEIAKKEYYDKLIHTVMKNIQEKMPFYNERHFQFEFAWALREILQGKNAEILFEQYYPTVDERDDCDGNILKEKKNYTDIVVKYEDGEFIAIELKYALNSDGKKEEKRYKYRKNNDDIVTIAKKGAADNACYDYLYDVHRLENLKNAYDGQDKNMRYENSSLKKFVAGYAIIISNIGTMWKRSERKTSYDNFRIDVCTQEECSWIGEGKHGERNSPIKLKKRYECNWKPADEFYFEDEDSISPPFKYLTIKVC